MARQTINIGAIADDGTGDSIRVSGVKINENFAEVYAQQQLVNLTHFEFDNNTIKGLLSNADIEMSGNGTGHVDISDLTIDSEINLSDNNIKTTTGNTNLKFIANGSGSVEIAKVDINGGTIDGTVIGGASPTTATMTTLNADQFIIDGVTVKGNAGVGIVTANSSNRNLELSGNGTGNVTLNGIRFPNTEDATGPNQVFQTNGSGVLSTVTTSMLFSNTSLDDGTATITGNSVAQTFDSFSASTYRGAKYTIQISDATANRFSVVEANVTHDGTNAYISTYGGADNGASDGSSVYDSLDFTAVISSGNVRVRGKVNNTNSQVIKFIRRPIKV